MRTKPRNIMSATLALVIMTVGMITMALMTMTMPVDAGLHYGTNVQAVSGPDLVRGQ
jgi:hypothetical protein